MDERVEHYDNSHILPLLEIYTMFMRYFQTISFQEYYSAQGMKKTITDHNIVHKRSYVDLAGTRYHLSMTLFKIRFVCMTQMRSLDGAYTSLKFQFKS